MKKINIEDTALLASLTLSTWSGRKHEPEADVVVKEHFNSSPRMGSFNKLLVSSESMSEIQALVSRARSFHARSTLPWVTPGQRLLPSSGYFDYLEVVASMKSEFYSSVSKMLELYDDIKDEAKKRLGDLYKETDYPEKEAIKDKFKFNLSMMPLQSTDTLKKNVLAEYIGELTSSMQEELDRAEANAISSLFVRIYQTMSAFHAKISKSDLIFRNSLVTNIYETLDQCESLNVFQDEELDIGIKYVKDKLGTIDIEALRNDSNYRTDYAAKAKDILDKVAEYV